ncbi:hypothetical protein C8R47DRAFT_537018 [Mycena vitilis]|nr:hypothetical protein C8R47DRAFT_537018 [Mycena vitilis]
MGSDILLRILPQPLRIVGLHPRPSQNSSRQTSSSRLHLDVGGSGLNPDNRAPRYGHDGNSQPAAILSTRTNRWSHTGSVAHRAKRDFWNKQVLVADSLFLYRCYIIWGSRWKAAAVPGFLMVLTFVASFLAIRKASASPQQSQPFEIVPYIMATTTNIILILLTAGRIWWIRRDALHVGSDYTIPSVYRSVIAMIVESGALYCATTILLIITYILPGTSFIMVQAAAMHLINIVPTLIIVRVGLARSDNIIPR